MTVVMVVAGLMLAVAAVLSVLRVTIGPRMLNRALAMEVVLAVVVAGLALEASYNRHSTTVPVMLAMAMVGFVGSVAVARYMGGRDDDPGPSPPQGAEGVGVE